MDNRKTIAILGGSFDPPHVGHLSLIKQALETGLIDEVWLMPNFCHPWKRPEASFEDRLAMCRLLMENGKWKMENGGKNKINVSDFEIKKGGKSYTIDTVRELKKKYPGFQFCWLIGKDLLSELPHWKNIEKLKKEIEFLSFPRTEVSSSEIREKAKRGLSITGLVPKEIEEYIKKHRLYQENVK